MTISEFIFHNMTETQIVILCFIAVIAYVAALLAVVYLTDAFLQWKRMRRALSEEESCHTMSPGTR